MKQTEVMQLAAKELPQLKAILSLNTSKEVDVETLALQELEYLQMIGNAKPEIFECLPASIISAIKTVLKQNLTLDPYAGLVYVKTRSVKVNNEWAKVLEIQPSANGLISINRQCGRVMDIERPEVQKDPAGKVVGVNFRYLVPSYNEAGKPCYKWREVSFDESDFLRWRAASHRENGRNKADANPTAMNYANPNYTSWKGGIDPEFARAKAIRHGLKKLGTNQNESRTRPLQPVNNGSSIIDHAADQAAQEDENHSYIEHEETPVNFSGQVTVQLDELEEINL
jgi:hypothetical protein